MLTRHGWGVGLSALAMIVGGRLLGTFELFLAGSIVAGLLVFAGVWVWATRPALGVGRRLDPPRVNAGNPARVELLLRNEGGRGTPVLRLHDPVSGTRGATLFVAPLPPGGVARAAYLLPTQRRGVLHVGPLQVTVTDPFGLAAAKLTTVGRSELVVYPRIDRLAPVGSHSGRDPHSAARQSSALSTSGEDFYALRPYVIGDDLRHVHWPSTARHDELMIRQRELPRHERTTVVLDSREAAHSPASFELAVSAAASILDSSFNRGDEVRLVTTSGMESGFGSTRAHLEAMLLHLATVTIDGTASLGQSLERLAGGASGGRLVIVAAALGAADLRRFGGLRARFGRVLTVMFEPSSWDPTGVDESPPNVADLVRVTRATPFVDAWNARFGGTEPPRGDDYSPTVNGERSAATAATGGGR